jgi:integrase
MSVFIRNGRFVVDYWPHGKKGKHVRKTLPAAITSIEEARAIEIELRQASKDPEINAPVTATVNDLFPRYLEWYELHRAARTYHDIRGCWKNHLSPHLGSYIASEITVNHINVYKRLRKKEYNGNYKKEKVPVGNRCIIKELAYFSGFMGWCHKNIKSFPKRDFQIDGLPYERPVPIVLSLDEAVRFIQAAEPLYRCLFLLLFNVGLRRSEARFLKWDDVDLENRSLIIIKKGGKPHILPISDWLYDELIALKQHSRSRWVFQSPRTGKPDQPVQDLRRAINRAREKAGITKRIYPHLLRHSLATHLMGLNINLRTIQNMLGHSQLSTTEFYTHVAIANLRAALSQAGLNINPGPGVYREGTADKGKE